MANKNKIVPNVYTLPHDVYFDAKSGIYLPIYDADILEDAEEHDIAFAEVPQSVLKDIYNMRLEEQKKMATKKNETSFGAFEETNPIDIMDTVLQTTPQPQVAKPVRGTRDVNGQTQTEKETAQLKMLCTPQYLEIIQQFVRIVKKEDPRITNVKSLVQTCLNEYIEKHQQAFDKAKKIVEE